MLNVSSVLRWRNRCRLWSTDQMGGRAEPPRLSGWQLAGMIDVNRDGPPALHITMVLPSSFEKAPTIGQFWCCHLSCRPL